MEPQKDKNTDLNIYTDLNLFNDDPFSAFLYRKCQSLVAALYLITDFFPDQEPLKWNIRDRSNLLLHASLSFSFAKKEERRKKAEIITSTSVEILSFCQLGSLTKLMSEMNFNILNQEFESLWKTLEKEREPFKLGINFVLDRAVFKGQESSPWPKDMDKGQTINKTPKGPLKDSKSDRKDLIVKFLREKGTQGIKEISGAFNDCSEKTIQRELIQLVGEGRLFKTGERRWSRYSVVS